MKNLRGANGILTGASRGIGPYVARALAAEGVHLALAARSIDQLEETRRACDAMGVRAIAVRCDVSKSEDLRRLVETVQRELGDIDVLVNNAGVEVTASVNWITQEDVDAILRTNLGAPIELTKLVLPGMLARRRGAIANMSSMAGKGPVPYNGIYAASKHGLIGFTSSLDIELEGTGVHAGVVCPGFVGDAGMWKDSGEQAPRMFREVSPETVAAAVVKVLRGATEVLVTPGPIRPLLALGALLPGLQRTTLKRLGVLKIFRERARQIEAQQRTERAERREPAETLGSR